MAIGKGINGQQASANNVRSFIDYWVALRKKRKPGQYTPEGYLPLKPNGEVAVGQVAKDAGVGLRAMTGQNKRLTTLYHRAKKLTLQARRRDVEAKLANGEGVVAVAEKTSGNAHTTAEEKEEIKRLKGQISSLEQQLGVLIIAYQQALDRVKELEKKEHEYERVKQQIARYEFQADYAVNPGPY